VRVLFAAVAVIVRAALRSGAEMLALAGVTQEARRGVHLDVAEGQSCAGCGRRDEGGEGDEAGHEGHDGGEEAEDILASDEGGMHREGDLLLQRCFCRRLACGAVNGTLEQAICDEVVICFASEDG
jgi:hypothetical protein